MEVAWLGRDFPLRGASLARLGNGWVELQISRLRLRLHLE